MIESHCYTVFRLTRSRPVRSLAWFMVTALLVFYVPLDGERAGSGIAFAQYGDSGGGDGQAKEEEKTKRTAAMSEKVYRKLAEAQEFADADDFSSAAAVLEEVKAMSKLSPYETAQVYNFYGFVYYAQERYRDSIRAYETVLQQPELPEGLVSQTMYTLAQLHFTVEEWQTAIDLINKWLGLTDNPPPEPFILIASAYYQLENYQAMIQPIERAMDIARSRDVPVKEQWYLLLRVAYYEMDDLRKVKDILEILVVNWPKKEYWTQLSGMYGELNSEKNQLAAYESAYDQGLLVAGREIVQLAQLFLQAEVPYKAASALQKGFDSGAVEKTEQNLRLYSQAWQSAGEFEKAIDPLKAAAAMSGDGDLDIRLAQSYLSLGRYPDCVTAAESGLRKGDLRQKDVGYEILGMCLIENKKFEDAKTAFRNVVRQGKDSSTKRANGWIRYIENEQRRIDSIEQSIEQLRRATS